MIELNGPIYSCVQAEYHAQNNPAFKGNPLIEALPPILDDLQLFESITYIRKIDPKELELPASERFILMQDVANFMVPLDRHIELSYAIEASIRKGYLGRAPTSPESMALAQKLYEMQMKGETFRQKADTITVQSASSLLGISGMGKTTSLKRLLARFPQCIYHQQYHCYQIPYIIVQTPTDGSSMSGLCSAILHQIDSLIPGANYFEEYVIKGRLSADKLSIQTARILALHYVGLLVCEEIQQLDVSNKGHMIVLAEMVSMCNLLKVPILFTGTNKAVKTLSGDFRQGRRAVQIPIRHWDRLVDQVAPGVISEWSEFMEVLWSLQWLRNPVPLDHVLLSKMYEYSQGVIGLAIALFMACQARAMANGSETITSELITEIYHEYFKTIHPMINALRKNDLETLAVYRDIAPVEIEQIFHESRRPLSNVARGAARAQGAYATPQMPRQPVAGGQGSEKREPVAGDLETEGGPAGREGHPPNAERPVAPKRKGNGRLKAVPVLEGRPDDVRNATESARRSGTSTMEELEKRGMAPRLTEVLSLD